MNQNLRERSGTKSGFSFSLPYSRAVHCNVNRDVVNSHVEATAQYDKTPEPVRPNSI